MTIEPIVFFVLIIAVLILCLTLGAFVISYTKIAHKLHDFHKEKTVSEKEVLKKSHQIIEETREKALKIIGNANLFEDSTKKIFEQELKRTAESQVKTLEKLSYDFLNVFQKELTGLKENNIKTLINISKDIENSAIAELNDFREILKKETLDSQKIVEAKIEEAYKVTQKEVEIYKAERLKIVEDKIYEIIKNVSSHVLAKSINLDEHEQLVIDALQKAKQEEVL